MQPLVELQVIVASTCGDLAAALWRKDTRNLTPPRGAILFSVMGSFWPRQAS